MDKVEAIKTQLKLSILPYLQKDDKWFDRLAQSIAQLFEAEKAEIFREIEALDLGLYQHSMGLDHYDSAGNEVLLHQSDCLKCKFEALKNKYLGEKK